MEFQKAEISSAPKMLLNHKPPLCTAPKILDKTEGAIFMAKLTREQKIEIYERRLKGETIKSLALNFNLNTSTVKDLFRLIEKYGYEVLLNSKNRIYSKEFKIKAINRVLLNHEPIRAVAVDIGLSSHGTLIYWIKKYKENCYNVIEKKKGRKTKTMTKQIKKVSNKILNSEEKIKKLEEENLHLIAEIEYLKKLNALVQEKEQQNKKKLK